MHNILAFFAKDLKDLFYSINEKQLNQFTQYYEMLVVANKKINLTAITSCDEVYKKHFIDSLSIIKYDFTAAFDNNLKVIDVGTGAGFPGIPLKIAYPQLNLTLLDSLNKRVDFLNEVIMQLGLSDIKAIHGRAEDFAHQDAFREKYDLCVSRAVANLSTLTEYCLPFVKLNCMFIAYKSNNAAEIYEAQKSIALLGGQLDKLVSFTLPNSDISRTLAGIQKIIPTPAKYPRRAGLPTKKPL
jgi:16S rRNA (guanine527-N7)-methyltransferase